MKVYLLIVESIDMPEYDFNILGVFKTREQALKQMHKEFDGVYEIKDDRVQVIDGNLDVLCYIKEEELQ